MPLICPFRGLRPAPGRASDVVAPPYDVLNTEEAREHAQDRPYSFLHISKPEIDLPEKTDPFAADVYEKGRNNFQEMLSEDILRRDESPAYYFYRLIMGKHQQTGLVAVVSVDEYNANRIRKHEFTRPDKEDDRVRQIDVLNAQTGPVFLTYPHSDDIDLIAGKATTGKADIDITARNGVRHTVWVVNDLAMIETITREFETRSCLYIADGHHRSAAAARVASARKNANPDHCGNESYNYFLSVIFPDNQVMILDYNRVVTDLNGKTNEEFLAALNNSFTVELSGKAVKPAGPGEFGMYLHQQWYKLSIYEKYKSVNDPVSRLDVSLLANHLIDPVLGIQDPRRDKRIDFVGGIRGLDELERRVDSGNMAVAFSLFPTSLAELMAVADSGEVMPPKSTWFEPKLADGLISHVLD